VIVYLGDAPTKAAPAGIALEHGAEASPGRIKDAAESASLDADLEQPHRDLADSNAEAKSVASHHGARGLRPSRHGLLPPNTY
jgi:hypothetical protein